MTGVLIIAHGNPGHSFVVSTGNILKYDPVFHCVSPGWNDEPQTMREKIKNELKEAKIQNGTVVITDIFGNTLTNASLKHFKKDDIETVTRLNLAILLKLAKIKDFKKPEKFTKSLPKRWETSTSGYRNS